MIFILLVAVSVACAVLVTLGETERGVEPRNWGRFQVAAFAPYVAVGILGALVAGPVPWRVGFGILAVAGIVKLALVPRAIARRASGRASNG